MKQLKFEMTWVANRIDNIHDLTVRSTICALLYFCVIQLSTSMFQRVILHNLATKKISGQDNCKIECLKQVIKPCKQLIASNMVSGIMNPKGFFRLHLQSHLSEKRC